MMRREQLFVLHSNWTCHSFVIWISQAKYLLGSNHHIVNDTQFSIFLTNFFVLSTVTSIYSLHILKYIAGSPIRRHFLRNKCIFKMSIRAPYSPHKLFRFICRRFEEKTPKICNFGLCQRVGTSLCKIKIQKM